MTGPGAGAVIFDMDGVLLDSGVHHRDAWRPVSYTHLTLPTIYSV